MKSYAKENCACHSNKVMEDSHPDPSVYWHHQEFYPCRSSGHVSGVHSNPKCTPSIEEILKYQQHTGSKQAAEQNISIKQ